ncbi:hypothetical protein Leryth_015355 [Lithospermum erythrorhizon]|nr:hypothetical protein Leryth_015355 [Lithospermum erythrorhizon]
MFRKTSLLTSCGCKKFKNPFFTIQIKTMCVNLEPNCSNLKKLCSSGQLNNALLEMAMQGLEMKFKDYDILLSECVNKRAYREGQRVHSHMIKTHYLPPLYLNTRLVVLYLKCEKLFEAKHVFDDMPDRNVVSWTAMISGYNQRGYAFNAVCLFLDMLRSGISPNEFTFTTVLTACSSVSLFCCGRQIHSLLVKSPYEFHMYVGSSLLDMYSKAGQFHEAQCVFESLPERDVVSCTAIISGYAQHGFDREALEVFRLLLREGMGVNYVTYASLLTALSGLVAHELGKQVHAHVLRSQISFAVVFQNSLIDMYSKCGNLTYARRIFYSISGRTVVSWNAMLIGYSKHGKGEEVVELFKRMKEENEVQPDSITFLAVLSACSHGGMEKEGFEIFDNSISGADRRHIDIEHYGCVVDMLGRAGQVVRALQFIEQLPIKPTAAIWGSLLGACRAHMNLDIGEIAGRRLLEIEPENAENYVTFANLYASAGRFEDVEKLRELMEEKAMSKESGKSWIQRN